MTGRYVIASEIGGIPELVNACKGVSLFAAGDSMALKETIYTVRNLSLEKIIDLGLQNREAFKKRFSNASSLKGLTDILEEVVNCQ